MKQMGLLTTVLVCSAALLVACGDEATTTSGAPGTTASSSTTTSGVGGSAATTSGSGGAEPATTSGSGGFGGTEPATTSGSGGGGMMANVTKDAEAFCADFGKTCSFGANVKDKYADQETCVDVYVNVFTPERRKCVATHLGMAKGGPADAKTHCPHAAGLGPCA